MKKLLLLLLGIVVSSVFLGCSSKKVFEPKDVKDDWAYYGKATSTIVDVASDSAMLESREVLLRDRLLDVKIDESYRLLGSSDGWVLSSTIDGKLKIDFIADKTLTKSFNLKKTIAAASIQNDILAVLFANNDMALYSISQNSLLVQVQGTPSIAVDSRIVNPYFMNDLVLFLTLDGKIVIVNSESKKKLRTTIVSTDDNFNNVIYFNVVDNKLIAATSTKILSMAAKEIRVSYEVRDIVSLEKEIFITTKEGEVISLTPDLQVNAKIKFPFAHFLGLIIHNDKLYILEKQGYLIEVSKDLQTHTIYEVDIDDGFVFEADKLFYVKDEYITLE
ncbi:hypothetical protein M947_00035 [Sulfurimonas hongkongensis]|uniref:Lipoprotein n=1 Tax=Sulfurimonas hongkongensis TaxID=1172190 RepID=T0JUI9_9BACT|nr:hypothetical protein [Sulfurimonas hongkongensis]EQB40672.1 hypothetical protein M947_00035 [Sulfurimonas hongkongensis]